MTHVSSALKSGLAAQLRGHRERLEATPRWPEGWCDRCRAAACKCPRCHGAGVYRVEGEPPYQSRTVDCDCRTAARTAARADRANDELLKLSMLASLPGSTFAAFDEKVKGVGEAYERAREYAESPTGWLILHGPTGVGKTHLAAAIGHFLTARRGQVAMQIVAEMLRELRRPFAQEKSSGYHEMLDALRAVPVLVLDDYGAEKQTDWSTEQLFTIVDERWRTRRPLVVTTNCLPRLEARVRDRLTDEALSVVVTISADSYRQRPVRYRSIPGGKAI